MVVISLGVMSHWGLSPTGGYVFLVVMSIGGCVPLGVDSHWLSCPLVAMSTGSYICGGHVPLVFFIPLGVMSHWGLCLTGGYVPLGG